MKILVYGAGVLGCNLARNLLRAGKDVTLLARGNWAAEIKQNGLRIKDKFSLRTSVSRIPVVTELAPDAMYDVIFVVLRYTQLDSVLDTLRANRTKNIVFVGNNVLPNLRACCNCRISNINYTFMRCILCAVCWESAYNSTIDNAITKDTSYPRRKEYSKDVNNIVYSEL